MCCLPVVYWNTCKPFRTSPYHHYGTRHNDSIPFLKLNNSQRTEICSHKHFSGLFRRLVFRYAQARTALKGVFVRLRWLSSRGRLANALGGEAETEENEDTNKKNRLLIQEPVFMVPVTGVEPVRYRYHRILSPTRLPIPSHRHITL